ncbi:MAG: site-2 protease family protein [Opitutales bacterium]
MTSERSGSFRIFNALGINVYLHWSWFIALIVFYELVGKNNPLLFLLLYGTLFGLVTLHEYGHALACRSLGGQVGHIVLWPLGGIAFVQPPPRPGALLWTITAGPLVNLVLIPVGLLLAFASQTLGGNEFLLAYFSWFIRINLLLFLFNMIPAFPLDGGQILQAILWFFMPRAKALMFASLVGLFFGGFMVVVGILGYISPSLGGKLPITPLWMALLGAFMASQAHSAYRSVQPRST